jgi:hypothetical protein
MSGPRKSLTKKYCDGRPLIGDTPCSVAARQVKQGAPSPVVLKGLTGARWAKPVGKILIANNLWVTMLITKDLRLAIVAPSTPFASAINL